jgi:hypothetical protein
MKFADNWEKFKVMIDYSSESEPKEEREECSWSEEAYEWSEAEEDYGWSDYEEEEDMKPGGLEFVAQLRYMRQARDTKQAFNGRQPM